MRKGRLRQRIAIYMRPCDDRYEELSKGTIARNIVDDMVAALVVASVAIPLGVGFAIACGLRPEQGIIGAAIASLFGALFGGSKYLVHGPGAAFIPVVGALMAIYDTGFLVLASISTGILLLLAGFFRFGRLVCKIPYSIIVGFGIGIAFIIVLSQVGIAFGIDGKGGPSVFDQLRFLFQHLGEMKMAAVTLTIFTIIFCKAFEKLSGSIPGPVPALIFGYIASQTFWADKQLALVGDKYGDILQHLVSFTPPSLPASWGIGQTIDLMYFVLSFFTIASVESIVAGRAADKVAFNNGFPFSPNRELRGLGMINIFSSLFNGLPTSANLGRSALNIRLKGRSPVTGIARFVFIIGIAAVVAGYIERLPLACIAGVLLYVASGKIKKREIKKIIHLNNYHVALMCYTAVAVPVFGFMTAVLSALMLYAICIRLFARKEQKTAVVRKG